MPLKNFKWDDFISERDGIKGIAGTAEDAETGKIVEIFVEQGALEKADELTKRN